MSNAAATSKLDERAEKAFFGAEGEIRNLRHMALIAWTLFQDTMKAPTGGDYITLQTTRQEFEALEFAVAHTMGMAGDLAKAFEKEFERKVSS